MQPTKKNLVAQHSFECYWCFIHFYFILFDYEFIDLLLFTREYGKVFQGLESPNTIIAPTLLGVIKKVEDPTDWFHPIAVCQNQQRHQSIELTKM